jgi:hypothetical protein
MSWRCAALDDLPFAHWVGQASDWTDRFTFSAARSDLMMVATTCSLLSPWV